MLKKALKDALRIYGRELATLKELDFYRNLNASSILYSQLSQQGKELIAPFLPYSKAQLAQDLFALAFAETAEPKYFVEFGATDGVQLSNTWLLEKKLGWNGILAEPAQTWHASLKSNRSCHIETKCVASQSNLKLNFLEVGCNAELSAIEDFANNGDHSSKLRLTSSRRFVVDTISLNDLLDKYNAPADIQFLSIDTEGSELDILEAYDFSRRKIRSICVEHNHIEPRRQSIRNLLLKNGYKHVFERFTKWDDWYLLGPD
jgi:FkbM family methyltransferase